MVSIPFTCRETRLSTIEQRALPAFFVLFCFAHFYVPASGQVVVTGAVPFSPPALAFNFHRA